MPFGEALGAVNDGVEYANRYITNKEVCSSFLSIGSTPTVGKEMDIP